MKPGDQRRDDEQEEGRRESDHTYQRVVLVEPLVSVLQMGRNVVSFGQLLILDEETNERRVRVVRETEDSSELLAMSNSYFVRGGHPR